MSCKPKISIIATVYNIKSYLRACLDSIEGQTFKDWELILIDDGSTDGSSEICDEYAARDSRIKLRHKKNSGLGDSRNVGLEMAEADIIGFIDSDDWAEPDMFQQLYDALMNTGSDIAVCGLSKDYENKSIVKLPYGKSATYSRDEALDLLLEDHDMFSYVWDKLFRKTVIKDKMATRFYEDYATTYKWMANANRIAAVRRPLYHYRQRQGSIDHHINPERNIDFLTSEIERYLFIKDKGLLPERQEHYRNKVLKIGVQMAKEISRSGCPANEIDTYLKRVIDMISPFLPASGRYLKPKHRLRLRKLTRHPAWFRASMQFAELFNIRLRHKYFSK